jgi:hypothetical protein
VLKVLFSAFLVEAAFLEVPNSTYTFYFDWRKEIECIHEILMICPVVGGFEGAFMFSLSMSLTEIVLFLAFPDQRNQKRIHTQRSLKLKLRNGWNTFLSLQ